MKMPLGNQVDPLRHRLHAFDYKGYVLIQVHAQLLCATPDVVLVDIPGDILVPHLALHRPGSDDTALKDRPVPDLDDRES